MKMLLVENGKKVAEFVARGLRSEGYALAMHLNLKSAREAGDLFKDDNVIMDSMLPGPTGTKVLVRVRLNE
jgi:DNA-binding response OmpR family regulator